MTKIAIRNMNTRRKVPPRFCDVIIEGRNVTLIRKEGKNFQEIPWPDFKSQVESAIRMGSE